MKARGLFLAAFALSALYPRWSAAEEPTILGQQVVNGGYGAPVMKLTTLAGDGVLLFGGEAGWILAHSVVVGGAGYGSVTSVVSPLSLQSTTGNAHLGIGYGGFRMGAIFANDWRVHGSFGVLLGGGTAWSENRSLTFHRSDAFVVIEPDLEAELNLTKYARFAVGAGYRFVGATEEPGFTERRLGGPSAMATLRFGEF